MKSICLNEKDKALQELVSEEIEVGIFPQNFVGFSKNVLTK